MDSTPLIIVASSVAAILVMLLVFAAGWMAAHRRGAVTCAEPIGRHKAIDVDDGAASRITLADVRERLRRLEAIAAAIDLRQLRFLHSREEMLFTSPTKLRPAARGHLL